MSAYLIVRLKVSDWGQYKKYTEATPEIVAKHQGKFIVRGGEKVTLEGPDEDSRLVVLEFPSMEKALAFYRCAEYQEAKKLRLGAATGQFVAVDGYG